MPEQLSVADLALIEEAAKKSGLVWLAPAGAAAPASPADPPQAMWHVWHDGAVTLVAGGAEQPLPAYATPGTPDWDAAAAALHAERLNLPEGDPYLDRWTTTSIILRLRPVDALIPPDGTSGAARPVPTPAVTLGRQPRMLGGVPKTKTGKPKKPSK